MDNITKYLQEVKRLHARGNATEHSYRPALKTLIESFGKKVDALNEPKRGSVGAPDLIVAHGQTPLGYIETKDIGVDLNNEEKSDQLKRYLGGLNNFIFTDYLEFRWFVNGEIRITARLATIDGTGKICALNEEVDEFSNLLNQFITTQIPMATSPKELAARMASVARIIRDIILKILCEEQETSSLHEQLNSFRKVLLHDIESYEFADMYAQTICYGLFAARCNHQGPKPFTRERAAFEIPETNPFLAEMFDYIAGRRLEKNLIWIVDHLAQLLNRADTDSILLDFGKRTRREDPVVHFYETFLAAYDPKMREARGVYYTPEPVVTYIVRSIDHILKNDFGLPDGLADTTKVKAYKHVGDEKGKPKNVEAGECHKVLILDPVVGTGTFLHGVIDQIHEQVIGKGGKGMWSGYVSKHLLPRLFGFELLMAPYAVAHMKLGLRLKELGYDFSSGERLKIYLTNTLEKGQQLPNLGVFGDRIAAEANAASSLKCEAPVMVILGNPPYFGKSANKGEWITGLLRGVDSLNIQSTENYFELDGKPLREKNSKWLNDDYVKFLRFGQWRIEQTGYGIMAMITNHGYLDNPTFRGMRQSLLKTFDRIYIIDLHGSIKKKETCPDGSKDQNVFDIRPGVAIGIFVKCPGLKDSTKLLHAHCFGLRKDKYQWLSNNQISTTQWQNIEPTAPFHLFIRQNTNLKIEYDSYWSIVDIMPTYGVGITTARDNVVIDFEKDPLLKRVKIFRDSDDSDNQLCKLLNMPLKKGWDIAKAREAIKKESNLTKFVREVTYRPFDSRLIFYHDSLVWRTVKKIMSHMYEKNNIALAIGRAGQVIDSMEWNIVFCTNNATEFNLFRRGGNNLFPLFLNAGEHHSRDLGIKESIISNAKY